jgi:valyl-tRNA synthetase
MMRSCLDHHRFQKLSRAVVETFCRLHGGIISRANRLVNWYVRLNTTLSNLEVGQWFLEISNICPRLSRRSWRTLLSIPRYDPKEKFESNFAEVKFFKSFFSIKGWVDERIVIATTRPEMMLGV